LRSAFLNRKNILIAILILAASLRLFGLSKGDVLGDEALYSFRAVGMMDFDEAEYQTTPLEWFDGRIPAWTSFSFHDHPLLVFFVQHIFIVLFGENNFAFRLPSALFGIAAIYLLYRIGTLLFSRSIGLLSALILAVTVNHVFISRVGLQESYVIFFLLLGIYFFLQSLRQSVNFIYLGIAIGLGLLAKITAVILVPVIGTYLIFFRPDCLRKKSLWIGAVLTLLIASPLVIYNLEMYRATGHFDFQFSYIFGQNPEVWKVAPGKEEIGALGVRVRNFFPNLYMGYSWLILGVFGVSAISFFIQLKKGFALAFRRFAFLSLTFFYLILLFLFIGTSRRFLTMLAPFIALSSAVFLSAAAEKLLVLKNKNVGTGIVIACSGLFLTFEIFYSVNSELLYTPKGPLVWMHSDVGYENYNWGYNELDAYLKKELDGKMPALTLDAKYQFLENVKNESLAKDRREGKDPYPALIIYDGNIANIPQLWILDRLQIYHGWPVLKTETYLEFLNEKGPGFFKDAGVSSHYFVAPGMTVPLKKEKSLTETGALFENELRLLGVSPLSIKSKRGEEVFRIYKF